MSRKRNSERTGAPQSPDDASPAAVAAATDVADIFSFVTPTDFVDLPSRGRFYSEGHPLHGQEVVELRHMTAKEEDILTSDSLLKKGLALDRMLQSLLVDKKINLDDFLIGDKNALVIASRITGFGPEYITNLTCPSCTEANAAEFDLETLTLNHVDDLPEEVTLTEGGTFTFSLPLTKVEIEVRLLTSGFEKKLAAEVARKKKLNLPDTKSTDILKAVIVSVAGVVDRGMINKFVELMPVRDSRYLRKIYEKIKPDVNLTHGFTCETCSYTGEVVMPLTAEFFWPNS